MYGVEFNPPTVPNSPHSDQLHAGLSDVPFSPQLDELTDWDMMSSFDDAAMLNSSMSELSFPHLASPLPQPLAIALPRSIGSTVGKLRLAVVGEGAKVLLPHLADFSPPSRHFRATAAVSEAVSEAETDASGLASLQEPDLCFFCSSGTAEHYNIELCALEDPKECSGWLKQQLLDGTPVDAVICTQVLDRDVAHAIESLTTLYTCSVDPSEEEAVLRHIFEHSGEIRRKRTILTAKHYEKITLAPRQHEVQLRPLQFTLNSVENVDPLRLGEWDTALRLCGQLLVEVVERALL